ncbi:ssDNA endodeoxyribonuclease [Actinomortierella ambigua]|nr:ssDNA endodeoxyribonuclease [Actinomortierella ambigua]
MEPFQCKFEAHLRNVKHLATAIKTINFKDVATCRIAPGGISFVLEESRSITARSLMRSSLFETYKYLNPLDDPYYSQVNEQGELTHFPQGYDPDQGSIEFGIHLGTLLACLNLFGTASGGSGGGAGGFAGGIGGDGMGANNAYPFSAGTSVRISFDGVGSPFNLILQDSQYESICSIPTIDPEPDVDFQFIDEYASKVAEWMQEALQGLDATSEKVVIRLSPHKPQLRISSLGTVENLDINYTKGEVIETFEFYHHEPVQASYNFGHIMHSLRAIQQADKVSMMMDTNNLLRIQFLISAGDNKWLFSEYMFSAIDFE